MSSPLAERPVLTDVEIRDLLRAPKRVYTPWRRKLLTGEQRYRINAQQEEFLAFAGTSSFGQYSAGIALVRGRWYYNLLRVDSPHLAAHANLEGDEPDGIPAGVAHIHLATERAQRAGYAIEKYAYVAPMEYNGVEEAIDVLALLANLTQEDPPQEGLDLWTEG